MFRELLRKKQRLSMQECVEVLKSEKRGVLSVNGEGGYPYGMPMNHWYNEEDGNIYFHCGTVGHRLDMLRKDGRASFCVYDGGYRRENEWALNIRSIVVFGRIDVLDAPEVVAEVGDKLSRKFTQDEEYIREEIRKFAAKTIILRLTPEHVCGKLVNES